MSKYKKLLSRLEICLIEVADIRRRMDSIDYSIIQLQCSHSETIILHNSLGSGAYEECKYCNKIINFLHTKEEIKEARIRTLTKKSEEIEEKLREVSKDE